MSAAGAAAEQSPLDAALGWLRRVARPAEVQTSTAARVVTSTLLALAAVAIWLVAYGLLLSGIEEGHTQHNLYNSFREKLAAGTAPLGGAIPEGTAVALLSAPAAGLDRIVVVEGTSSKALESGPGHLPGKPLPGQAGAAVIMGRSTSFGAPFAKITHVHQGDLITAVTGQGTFTYVVEDVRRPHDPLPPALKQGGGQLTLVTAEGGGWRTGWAPSHQVYVDALLKGTAVATPSSVGLASDADQAMHGDTRGLYPLILWMQLLLIALVGGVWAWHRWGRWQSWLVAVPVAFTGLWGASGALWLLLPNLM